VNSTVAQRLREGQSICVFPEGTTTDGTHLLRFHANLVQAAFEASAPVVPLAVQYWQDKQPSLAAAYIGDTSIFESTWSILRAPRLTARLHWLPATVTEGQTRHAVADSARSAIATTLQLSDRPGVGAMDGDVVAGDEDLSVL
jgi:1-acyl-sn-glycerol-3-phosphate acyltransferase